MKVTVQGGELSNVLSVVGNVVPTRATRPLLQNVCLLARGGGMEVLGTDMEVGVRHRVEEIEVHEEGEILLPPGRLQGIARELAGGQVEISASDGKVEIRAPGCYFKLVGEDPGDFPVIPAFPAGSGVALPVDLLSSLVRRVIFSAASEESRYAIHGVLLEMQSDEIRVVATDGKRLAWATGQLEKGAGKKKESALLPARGLGQILKGVEPGEEEVRVIFEERRVLAQVGRSTVVASRIEGTFPNYEEVVPAKSAQEVIVDRENFAACVRRGALLATEGSHAVVIEFTPDHLKVGAKVSNVGEGEIEMGAEYGGEPVEIHFNPRYLLDFLKVAQGEKVRLGINDSRSAVVFRDEGSLLYVVMPITVEATP